VICYFDTSAFVPLLIEEPSPTCRALWESADDVTTTRLLYVETAAALARAERSDRIKQSELRSARRNLEQLWPDFDVIDIDDTLSRSAADMAAWQSLRGFDALHCAAAEQNR
jgi:predicted nucleic acid-binding protein